MLLLDEPTSALDETTEAEVMLAVDSARVRRTTLIVAHRRATIERADIVVSLSEGKPRSPALARRTNPLVWRAQPRREAALDVTLDNQRLDLSQALDDISAQLTSAVRPYQRTVSGRGRATVNDVAELIGLKKRGGRTELGTVAPRAQEQQRRARVARPGNGAEGAPGLGGSGLGRDQARGREHPRDGAPPARRGRRGAGVQPHPPGM